MTILLAGADRRSQWYGDTYPGSRMAPNVIVLHTTEGGDWPGYGGGATAPNLTVKADKNRKRLVVRQHYSLDRSSRALRNLWGGVETNTLNVIQIELVGSCDRRDGYGAIYWPDAPEWCYRELGELLAQLRHQFPAIPLTAPKMWLAYGPDPRRPGVTPASYGDSPARMSFAEWRAFRGICGHQHVPENAHGDPGDLPIDKILRYAGAITEEDPMASFTMADLVSAAQEGARAALEDRRYDSALYPDARNSIVNHLLWTNRVVQLIRQETAGRVAREVVAELRAAGDLSADVDEDALAGKVADAILAKAIAQAAAESAEG